jgi:hypothetical protein
VAELDRIEHGVATALARYLNGAAYDESAAFHDVVPDLSLWLGALLARHLTEEERWSPYWAIDDASPDMMEGFDADTVRMTGVVWLLADDSAHPSQPFQATIRVAPSRDALASYTLQLGDAAIGMGRDPSLDHLRRSWPAVDRWLFEFSRPTVR